ncbi:MAG: preprotein translocase subunit Sec61beta [DPANN group archaeon]|nr:preprotein translocase subunit Sec61beta [DPANN group archaeon]
MPSGIGGLVRYFDEYKSKIEIKPGHVLVAIGLIIFLMILLNMFGNSWLGI